MNGMEYVLALQKGEIETSGFIRELDTSIKSFISGKVVMKTVLKKKFCSLRGILLGGVSASLLDFAMGMGLVSSLGESMGTFTLEMKINYLRAIKLDLGEIEIEGTVIHAGRKIAHTEGVIVDADGAVYAKGIGTFIIMNDGGLDKVAKAG